MHALTDRKRFFSNPVTVKTIHYFACSSFFRKGNDWLSVSIFKNGNFKQLHFWWSNRVGIVIVCVYVSRWNPNNAINWLAFKG